MSSTAAAPDPRVEQMRSNPEAYFRKARERARREAEAATRRERELRQRQRKD